MSEAVTDPDVISLASSVEVPAPVADEAAAYARLLSLMKHWMSILTDPDQCIELRCLNVTDGAGEPGSGRTSTQSGWFRGDELDALARAAIQYSDWCSGVYYTLNPLKDRWGQRARWNGGQITRMDRAEKGQTAKDSDVTSRRWFMVDVDPVRAKGHEKDSATDTEKAAAFEVVKAVQAYLAEQYPPGILSDSGNGYHLLYRVANVEVTAERTAELRKLLMHLDAKFSTKFATVDRSVFNPSRIVKFPGTRACKGEETEERPWRRAKVLEIPGGDESNGS